LQNAKLEIKNTGICQEGFSWQISQFHFVYQLLILIVSIARFFFKNQEVNIKKWVAEGALLSP
jgi:hypothetical protein